MTEQEYDVILNNVMKKFNKNKPDIPARIIETNSKKILQTYESYYKRLFNELLDKLNQDYSVLNNPSYQSQLANLKLVENRLAELNSSISVQMQMQIESSYVTAGAFHVLMTETIDSIEALKGYVPYSSLNTYKMEQLVSDTMEDLLYATSHTSKELKKYVREIFGKNLQYHGLNNESQSVIKKLIEQELSPKFIKKSLSKKGFVGIVDSAGRRWNLKTYIDMAVSTKLNQAYTEGLRDRAVDTGKDLAKIPEKGATDSCAKFEGMIISLTGATEGYMTYDQLKATGLIFHPRCAHSPFPIGNVELLHEDDIAFHEKKMQALKKDFKNK